MVSTEARKYTVHKKKYWLVSSRVNQARIGERNEARKSKGFCSIKGGGS
jgi:hypothetical protein